MTVRPRRTGLLRAARRPGVRRTLTGAFRRLHIGGDGFAVRALTGRSQSRVTGLVAAYVVREVLTGTVPAGVHHIEQLPALAGLPETLARAGVTLRQPER
ncbi:hypothetical protein [Streptomyces gobiensis]|uniref:hypothetical protein n=1 Tax=Streptomyces gobiensis TaxID=2875706 RepID=UPI001E4208E4|nr:hypothetical protein [Streptomyces gobiensis]UGY90299.1 hypothetical protein test1122_00190 [Streptomyces gobiensis]